MSRAVYLASPIRGGGSQSTVTVLTSSTDVLSANTERRFLLIQVIGATDVYLTVDGATPTTTPTNGEILLKGDSGSGGGSIAFTTWVPNGTIKAIAATSSSKISVIEG